MFALKKNKNKCLNPLLTINVVLGMHTRYLIQMYIVYKFIMK